VGDTDGELVVGRAVGVALGDLVVGRTEGEVDGELEGLWVL